MTADPRLDELVDSLERAAADLRAGELAPEHAAALVDECARLATEAGSLLERAVRAGDEGGAPGQLPLGT